jgi:3-deoxy-D-manno-oct-2-ulosonic acid (Kdo) hydroxylase
MANGLIYHEGAMEAPGTAAALVEVTGYTPEQARGYCQQLESGQVLFFRTVPFDFPADDRYFLLSQQQTGSRFHKNISYRPATDLLKGVDTDSEDRARLHRVMQGFSREVTGFVAKFLAPYAGQIKLDFASFRPLEEQGRDLPLHKRNDLLHVDAFPTRPTRGGRILRVFVNINPSVCRVWNVGEPFHIFAPPLVQGGKIRAPHRGPGAALAGVAARLGLPVRSRSRYDEFMLYLHDWLKENAEFQKDSPKREVSFPPGCCWMAFTDGVPHAAMSGQFALEQTFIVPAQALVSPEVAPIRVLENATGRTMAS